jgi:hypothetical protein
MAPRKAGKRLLKIFDRQGQGNCDLILGIGDKKNDQIAFFYVFF